MDERYLSSRGRIDVDQMQKGPNGNPLCRWCFTETSGKRKTFCSNSCLHEHRIRADGTYLRKCVFKRDKGVCASCRRDTTKIKAQIIQAIKGVKLTWKRMKAIGDPIFKRHRYPPMPDEKPKNLKRLKKYFRRNGLYWDADHIQRVVEGGGSCGLDNVQTLCKICHKRKTRRERRRQASGDT